MLVVTPIYPWPGSPAEGIFVHRQVRNLTRLGHAVRVIGYHPAVPGLPRSLAHVSWLRYHPRWMRWPRTQDGVRVEHVFYPQRRWHRRDAIPAIADAISRLIDRSPEFRQTDIVYAHWLWTGGAAALALRDRYGWPVAAIARGSEMHRWQSIHCHCRSHVARVIQGADLVLANCDYLRGRASDLVPAAVDRVRVARNGCDHDLFRPGQRAQRRRDLGLSPGARYLLCCATITEHKGIPDLAAAWQRFAPVHPDWRLLVIGPVAEGRVARDFTRRAGDRARLRGPVPADRVVAYMQAADAYVQPSRLEGLSNATMEAMAVGLPVVATSAGGQGELVRDGVNGWLAPVGEPVPLSRAMHELATNRQEAEARGAAARRTIIECFDPLRETGRLSDLFVELHARIAGSPPG